MKKKASSLVKNIISVVTSMAKAKIMEVRAKAEAMRARLLVLSLLRSKKLSLGSLSRKIHALLDRKADSDEDIISTDDVLGDESKAIVLYSPDMAKKNYHHNKDDDADDNDNDKYPDLTHSLFAEEDMEELDDDVDEQGTGSVIDLVKHSKEHEGEDFILEDEIDHVADLFIKRFRKQIRLQKLESFKQFQEMLHRGT